jgi:hypothetical protein
MSIQMGGWLDGGMDGHMHAIIHHTFEKAGILRDYRNY